VCGLDAAHSRVDAVGGRDVLLVKRFDRKRVEGGYERARMASALTLLRADENQRERWSYVFLAEEMRRVVAEPLRDLPELFRRMCFNALISNVDDHPRNHAVIAPGQGWQLSPAYDLTPATPISTEARDLAMSCGDMGRRASAANLLSQAQRFLLKPDAAAAMVEGMRKAVEARWYDVCRSGGVSEADCGRISTAFAYEGFGRAA
jgi:serine/threonine-protein kinase HipA